MILAETYWELMRDVPHALFELTWEVLTGIVVWPIGRALVRRHDRKHHSKKENGNAQKEAGSEDQA